MIVVDSCGWLEWFADGPLASAYGEFLGEPADLIVPTVVLYEVYKVLSRTAGEDVALRCAGFIQRSRTEPLGPSLVLEAADVSRKHGLAMADAVVYATALRHRALLVTSDRDLEGLPGVRFLGA